MKSFYVKAIKPALICFLASFYPALSKADHVEEEFSGTFCQTIQNDYKNDKSTPVFGFYKDAKDLAKGKKPHGKLLFRHGVVPELVLNGIPCGAAVRFKGRDTHSKRIRVDGETFVYAGGSGGAGGGDSAAPSGEQRLLAFRVNFLDSTVACSASAITSSVFTASNSLNAAYVQASYGALSFSGDVFETTINFSVSGTTCDYYGWASAAEAAATSAGINVSLYPRRLFFLPSNAPCGWGGVANLGGNPSRAWVRGCSTGIAIHEEGHNMTMHHASSFLNGTLSEYGDSSDPMGGAAVVGFNAPHKVQMGWLSTSQVHQSGTATLSAVNLDPVTVQNPQILKVPKPDTAEDYYIAFRDASGFDGSLSTTHKNRLAIHRFKGGMVQTVLLGTLGDGQSFTDPVNNYTFTLLGQSASTATIEISLLGGPVAPAAALSPATQTGAPGATASYTVQITNRDTATNSSTFNLAFSGAAGFSGSFASNSLTLTPGQTGSTTVSVTSPADSASGYYNFNVNISDVASTTHNASVTGTFSVTAQDVTPPSIVILTPQSNGTLSNKTLIKAQASDAQSSISQIQLSLNGTVVKTCSNKTLCQGNATTNSLSRGTHTISATATDSAGNVATTSITVSK